jgi:NOL1/NOP2/fmu family ribosome biogenesis protein
MLQLLGNRLYLVPANRLDLEGLRVIHWGWWIGTVKTNTFIPSPALAAGIRSDDAQIVLEFSLDQPDLISYLRGIPFKGDGNCRDGDWILVTVTGHSIGWAKQTQGKIKSYLPTWLRLT